MPLFLAHHRRQKPRAGLLKLNIGNELVQGLVSAFVLTENGGTASFDAAAQQPIPVAGSTWISTPFGPGVSTTGSSGSSIKLAQAWGPSNAIMGPGYTQMLMFRNDNTGQHGYVYNAAFPSQNRDWGIIYGFNANQYEAYVNAGTGNGRQAIFTGSDSNFHTLALTVDAAHGGMQGYFDGVRSTLTTAYAGGSFTGLYDLTLGDAGRNTDNFAGTFIYAYMWSRVLTPAEVASMLANPYQIFQQSPLLTVPVGGGGASHPLSGSATQPQSLSLSRQPRLIRSLSQTQALTTLRAVVLTRSLSQTQVLSIVVQKVVLRAVSATQAQLVKLTQQARLTRSFVSTQVLVLGQQARVTRSIVQTQALLLSRQFSLTKLITQAQSLSLLSQKVFLLARSLTQAQALSLRRLVTLTRATVQPQLATAGHLALSRALLAIQASAVMLGRAVRLTRSLSEPTSVSIGFSLGTHVYVITVTARQAEQVALIVQHGGASGKVFRVLARTLVFAQTARNLSFTVEKR